MALVEVSVYNLYLTCFPCRGSGTTGPRHMRLQARCAWCQGSGVSIRESRMQVDIHGVQGDQ